MSHAGPSKIEQVRWSIEDRGNVLGVFSGTWNRLDPELFRQPHFGFIDDFFQAGKAGEGKAMPWHGTHLPYDSIGFLKIWLAENAHDVDAGAGPLKHDSIVTSPQSVERFFKAL